MLTKSNGRRTTTRRSEKPKEFFSRIANSADEIGSAIALLFEVLPALKEYDHAGPDSGQADFRGHIDSIKQSVLQDPAQLVAESVHHERPVHLAIGHPGASEHDESRSKEPSLSSESRYTEEWLIDDLKSIVHDFDEW